jgi:protein TonB
VGGHSGEEVFFVELEEARLVAPGGEEGKAAPALEEPPAAKKAQVKKTPPRPEPEEKKKEPQAAPPPEPVAPEAGKIAAEETAAPEPPSAAVGKAPENIEADSGGDAFSEEEGVSSAGASSTSDEVSPAGAAEREVSFPQAGFGDYALSSGPGLSRAEALARIRKAIEEELTYPPLARRRRLEGTVLAGFAVDEGGAPHDIEIVRSSGFSILDDEVVKIIRRAAPFPHIPERVEVPVSFRLVGPR